MSSPPIRAPAALPWLCLCHLCPKDPNQLIRASALRVLSSIRVPIIVPIMMLAIKEAASDMSPYVRKTAAHAIPKLYRYAPSHCPSLASPSLEGHFCCLLFLSL